MVINTGDWYQFSAGDSLWHAVAGHATIAHLTQGESGDMNIRLAGLAALACCVAGVAIASAEIDAIGVRRAGMALQGSALGAVKLAVGAGAEVKSFAGAGSAFAAWAKQIPGLFPPGTDKGDTKALSAVWSDSAGFAKSAVALGAAADKLTAAAKANDKEAFAAAFKAVGDACGDCHKTYREK
jgi:cytochrome c556